MKVNKYIVISALSIAMLGVSVMGVAAYQGDYTVKGPETSPERHTAMEKAFDNNDYQAWKELMGDRGRVTEVITEANFTKFAEAHRLAEAGDYAGADAIRAELGLRTRNGEKTGNAFKGRGMNKGQGQNRANCDCQK
jgi:hypothetical protein